MKKCMYMPVQTVLDLHQHTSNSGNCLCDPTVLYVTLYLPENKTTPSQPSIFWKIPIFTLVRILHHSALACLHHHENMSFFHDIPSTIFNFKSFSACLISIKLIFSLYVQSTNIGLMAFLYLPSQIQPPMNLTQYLNNLWLHITWPKMSCWDTNNKIRCIMQHVKLLQKPCNFVPPVITDTKSSALFTGCFYFVHIY